MEDVLMVANPTLLLVDDKIEEVGDYVALFEELGQFEVVTARSREEARRRVRAEPGIEAVSTDISLESEGIDIEGAKLASELSTFLPGIPIAGYSGFRGLDALPAEYQPSFRHWIERGVSADTLSEFVLGLREDALEYRASRALQAERVISDYELPTSLADDAFERVAHAWRPGASVEELEEALGNSGFVLRAVMPVFRLDSKFRAKSPIVCWLRASDGDWEGEVIGQPQLYAAGRSADSVLEGIVGLVEVFAELLELGLPVEHRQPRDGPAEHLSSYLEAIVEWRI